ncbi:N-acyl homoserine lactonase family protein [Butyricicoccus faecihominis]|uniref:N-acyl homoserine lactonase family protein n=1 Tax=Butyricicoccus faecihominis TaxID=1712515 RepID=UPI002478657C|nr:N-acyl homoserine lactonase family protein [Butyricicoccus faecihominis]MCQ5130163.1 N-acyl homoserine lactonase family protein [Butyricicoccus faecihominis]
MKGLAFAIIRYGSIWNDPAWNVAVPNPATAHHPRAESVFTEYPASFILIRHPKVGYILYDVGDFPDGEDGVPRPVYWKEYFRPQMRREDYIDRILPRYGVQLSEVSHIILSHMHYDHAGGIKFFKGTHAAQNVFVPKEDFVQGCLAALTADNEQTTESPYWRSIMTAPGIAYHLLEEDTELFPGVKVLLLPGHTPAVGALLLELESGNYLFPNDACSSRINYGPPVHPTAILYDSLGYEKSVIKLRRIEREHKAKLIYSHDLQADQSYRHFPYFYE